MANLYYNDRLIVAFASLNQSDKQWSAGAEITWKVDGQRHSHSISGLLEPIQDQHGCGEVLSSISPRPGSMRNP